MLVAMIVLMQYPLWLGKGGWLSAYDLDNKVTAQKQANRQAQACNAELDAEVRDLKQGTEAIEERARGELGMVKPGKVFFYVLSDKQPPDSLPASAVSPTATRR